MTHARLHRLGVRPEVVLGWLGAALFVVGVYAVVVRGGGVVIGRTSSPHMGLSLLATAIVAITIEPVRGWVQRASRDLLRRGRPSPYDVLAGFAQQVEGSAATEHTPGRIARMLAEGTGVDWAQVWLLVNGELTLIASHPPDASTRLDPPALSGTDPHDGTRSVPVGHAGNVLGVLRVQERERYPLTPVGERLFAGLAAQAGLVLHSAQLEAELTARHAELSVRAGELRRSRDELVDAQNQERRRLERDIHDGAQQQLVALGINLRLAQTLLGSAPDQSAQLLLDQSHAAADAIETLSALSRGVYPEVLRERGLPAALTVAAGNSPVPVLLDVEPVGRFSNGVETTIYFCGLEALQNVAKHARATAVEVSLSVKAGQLRLTVSDNGSGLSPSARAGVGVSNMRDRAEALGGRLLVEPGPVTGTVVTAVVPAVRVPQQRRD